MIEFFKQKKNIVIGIIIVIIIVGYYIYNKIIVAEDKNTQMNILEVSESTNEKEDEEDVETIIVHITGAINKPGIVRLKENSRIEDAIEAAGGLTEDSDISSVNLAYPLEDGVKIRIPTIDDEKKVDSEESYITDNSGSNVLQDDETNKRKFNG
ncbi:MAG: hypothetical protein HFJ17_03410 [Clostridia bacterium]|nr:hypothetical protein [Clostridia bacterium]